jgi:hypothetical protein
VSKISKKYRIAVLANAKPASQMIFNCTPETVISKILFVLHIITTPIKPTNALNVKKDMS